MQHGPKITNLELIQKNIILLKLKQKGEMGQP